MCCRLDKARENAAALEVLPDLLTELDGMAPAPRLTALIEGCLAANIFDWGAKACVDLYHNGTILEIYRCGHHRPCALSEHLFWRSIWWWLVPAFASSCKYLGLLG